MSRKPKLDEDALRSELSESRFFRRDAVPDEQSRDQPGAVEAIVTSAAQPAPADVPSVRPYVRTLTRMPFEIYRDQHAALKKISLEEQSRGEKSSMSQMVREAIDMYLAKRRGGEG